MAFDEIYVSRYEVLNTLSLCGCEGQAIYGTQATPSRVPNPRETLIKSTPSSAPCFGMKYEPKNTAE
ncbi:MAG: hypothetical protein EAZ43_07035 [Betaproteobacteria bacterium]|nr:MAG: hypothetical protein EAZ43_07035 [Betaproteobacteria bacterium]